MMMRKIFTTSLILSAALALSACGRSAMPNTSYHSLPQTVKSQSVRQATQLIVRFQPNATRLAMQNFNQKYQLQTVNYLPQLNAYVMNMRAAVSSQAALQAMLNSMQSEAVTSLVEINHEIQVAPVNYDVTTMPVFEN